MRIVKNDTYNNEQYNKAKALAMNLFIDKKDKGGKPYINHIMAVKEKVMEYGTKATIVAVLHDVLEDTTMSATGLINLGFDEEIVRKVEILTRNEDEIYMEYIQRIINSGDLDALLVKRADLEHNMNLSRLRVVSERDVVRLEKRYIPAWYTINSEIGRFENE